MSGKKILSIIVLAHDEYINTYKTIRSLLELKIIQDPSTELIIHIDSDRDNIKTQLLARFPKSTIYQNKFHDIGKSRNFATQKARGEYLAFLNVGDFVSANWVEQALKYAQQSKEPILLHPEATLIFGLEEPATLLLSHNSDEHTPEALLSHDQWSNVVLGQKKIFEDHPYLRDKPGYESTSYLFNIKTLSDGIHHNIIPETVHFYRRRDRIAVTCNQQLHKMKVFDDIFDTIKNTNTKIQKTSLSHSIKSNIKQVYVDARNVAALNTIIEPCAELAKKVLHKDSLSNIPKFVLNEWAQMNWIENQLYPLSWRKSQLKTIDINKNISGHFTTLMSALKKKPDYIIITPWLIAGGADKVVINYIKSIQKIHPKWHVAVITTLPVKNVWAKLLPENASFIDFGNQAVGLKWIQKDNLFSSIITQMNCKKIHIINSEYGFIWCDHHQQALRTDNYTLYASLFCHDILARTDGKGIFSYADPYLLNIYPIIKKIFTDNEAVIKRTCDLYGLDPDRFIVHYQPSDMKIVQPKLKEPKGKYRILWASKISNQKYPELLCRIAKKLDPSKYQIDVFGRLDVSYSKRMFANIPTINYRGAYDGIDSLKTDYYDLFLYTSLTDGIPNILLEMVARGLPVLASDAGGIGEVIQDGKTGLLVQGDNIERYIKDIQFATQNYRKMHQYAEAAQKLMTERHNWQKFDECVKKDLV